MKNVLIIGSGISGLCAAIASTEASAHVVLVSPTPSERTQSVMAAGGINGALDQQDEQDSCQLHAQDTLKGGQGIADKEAVYDLCHAAPKILNWLEALGTEFSRDENGRIDQRAFGGQSRRRTAYCGASTGKHIVTALTRACRKLEASGSVDRSSFTYFLELLIEDGLCCGAVLWDKRTGHVYAQPADAVILATGGQNRLFGKTTGSILCDGTAAAQAFRQGCALKNLEMIQYHPTTIETTQKRMLISEAARAEGGRLFYYKKEDNPTSHAPANAALKQHHRVYFMEDKYGPNGNLMPRDVVSREIDAVDAQVYLDVSFLGEKHILEKLSEIYDLCMRYIHLDITQTPIPVSPSVHFFMGGLAVNRTHETTIKNLFAVGECAAMYHGANRLGGNSLLAACYSGLTAGRHAAACITSPARNMDKPVHACQTRMRTCTSAASKLACEHLMRQIAQTMNTDLGLIRHADALKNGLENIQMNLNTVQKLKFDPYSDLYRAYMAENTLLLSKAILKSALARQESRGAHYRTDFPKTSNTFKKASLVHWNDGRIDVSFEEEEETNDR